MKKGMVYLVGAGPGDPGLLTKRAIDLMKSVDVIAYDALISPSILMHVGQNVELVSVGYRGHGGRKLAYRIHPTIVERSLQGKTVLRLKSGDPLIFGRLAQECEELRENEIPFEVVPGVTSGLAASAYAGFPLTHRDHSSDVIISSGHDLGEDSTSHTDWGVMAKSTGTVLIYMAGTKIRENCQRLIDLGRSGDTPAAIVANGTRSSQRVFTGTLATLSEVVGVLPKGVPAVLVIGTIVKFREDFSWFEKRPLWHQSVMVVRSRSGGSQIADDLRAEGADVLEAPWVNTKALDDKQELEKKIKELPHYRNLIFSCAEGVTYFFDALLKSGRDSRSFYEFKITAAGLQASSALRKHGLIPDITLTGQCENALAPHLSMLAVGKSLVIGHDRGREKLNTFLKSAGVDSDYVATYSCIEQFPHVTAPAVNWIILPSSTSAKILLEGPWGEALKSTPMIALGEITREAALSLGATTVFMTKTDDPKEIVPLIKNFAGVTHD